MLPKLPKPRLLAAALLSASAITAMANPVVIDFESAPPLTLVGPTQTDTQYTEGGVTFTPSGGDAQVDLSFCALGFESCISNNDTTYLSAFNGATVTISTSHWFTLDKLDAAFFPAPTPAGFYSGLSFGLHVAGTLLGGGTAEATLNLIEDVFAGDFLFSSYAGLGTAQLQSVTFSACWFDSSNACVRGGSEFDAAFLLGNDLAFALDNVAVSIPEPSALWLAGLGLAGLAANRRRRTAR
jgi:PEP-CTERM motif